MNEVGRNQEIPSVERMSPEISNFKEIKPEEGMTYGKSQEYWDAFFEKMKNETDSLNDNNGDTISLRNSDSFGKLDSIHGNYDANDEKTEPLRAGKDKVAEHALNNLENNWELKSQDMARTPSSNGEWSGEKGNSKWYPDKEYVPPEKSKEGNKPYSNPENKTWGELLKKYGIDGIEFKNGFPDFSEISRGTVEIEGFETGGNAEKNRNFAKADVELAKQRGCSPDEVAKWRKENNYTWHECEDKKTMQKVPNEIHANIKHDGGRSQT